MSTPQAINRRFILARRPQGEPSVDDFVLEKHPVPAAGPEQLLLRTRYLSLDPYMRGRMNDVALLRAAGGTGGGDDRADGERGGGVQRARASRSGTWCSPCAGWQDYAVLDARQVTKIDPSMPRLSYALGVLGMPGLTAYVGLLDIGEPKPGETVVVGAATGGVGSIVGQIAKIKGCRVVGVAGGRDKCDYAVKTLGFDACVDHRDGGLREALAAACPQGIDVYFENVGGVTLAAVMPLMNIGARMPVCGLVAWYNLDKLPEGVDRTPQFLTQVLKRRIKVQGFIIFDHFKRMPEFYKDMSAWVKEGTVRYREEILEDLENAPQGLIGLLRGENFGKLVVRVSGS